MVGIFLKIVQLCNLICTKDVIYAEIVELDFYILFNYLHLTFINN